MLLDKNEASIWRCLFVQINTSMMMSNLDSLSVNGLFRGALEDAVKASALSPLGDESQV